MFHFCLITLCDYCLFIDDLAIIIFWNPIINLTINIINYDSYQCPLFNCQTASLIHLIQCTRPLLFVSVNID